MSVYCCTEYPESQSVIDSPVAGASKEIRQRIEMRIYGPFRDELGSDRYLVYPALNWMLFHASPVAGKICLSPSIYCSRTLLVVFRWMVGWMPNDFKHFPKSTLIQKAIVVWLTRCGFISSSSYQLFSCRFFALFVCLFVCSMIGHMTDRRVDLRLSGNSTDRSHSLTGNSRQWNLCKNVRTLR